MARRLVPRASLAALLLAAALPARAARGADDGRPPAVLPGESRPTAGRLAEARKRVAQKQWAEAVDELQAVLDAAGDDLVPVDERRSVQARRLCHAYLAALPPEGLRLYRARVDARARKWLEQGEAARDARLLRKVADEAFCSRPAERALDLLGDLAFERGRFEEAGAWWALLAPLGPPGGGPAGPGAEGPLTYPDPQGDPARVRAKQLAAQHFRGADAGWAARLREFRGRHGEAAGELAGRRGRLADLLADLARDHPGPAAGPAWSTFGGDGSRGLVLPAPPRFLDRLSALCRNGPTWRFRLQDHTRLEGDPAEPEAARGAGARARTLAVHPLLVGHHALVADARFVTAYDLRNGSAEVWYDAARAPGGAPPGAGWPPPADLRYTLTAAGDCVCARLGRLGVDALGPDAAGRRGSANNSVLACLRLAPGPGEPRCRWAAPAPPAGTAATPVFEGAPLAHDGRLYIAATRVEGERAATAVYCYPAEPAGEPAPQWRQDVVESTGLRPSSPHHLLTLAGGHVVYCSHSGAVVALEADTGRRAWAVRYPGPSAPAADRPPLHDLAPPVFAAGRLYVAPTDSDRVLCLEPATGRPLWERDGIDVVHLLGVGQGRLIFTTPTGLRALDAADGSDVWQLPDVGGGRRVLGGRPPMGRGLLIGDLVLWPTVPARQNDPAADTGIVLAVRQEDGHLADNPTLLHQVPAGNLVYADGCLAVADRDTLSVFVPPAVALGAREAGARSDPASAAARLALARAEADAGLAGRARASFTRAEEMAARLPAPEGRRLRERVRAERRWALLEAGRRAAESGRPADAARDLGEAAAGAPAADRLDALVRTAEAWQEAGQPAKAIAAWQSVLAEDDLRDRTARGQDGLPRRAGELAAVRIAALYRESGAAAYAAVEEQARAAAGGANPSADVTEQLARTFPNAAVTRDAALALARREEAAGRAGAAVRAWRLLASLPADGEQRAAALRGLAQAYDKANHPDGARAARARLRREYGAEAPAPYDPAREPVPARRPLRLPLVRSWQTALALDEELLPADESAADGEGLLTCITTPAGGAELVCRSFADGRPCWRCPLPFRPSWAGRHADLIVVAGAGGAAAVGREDGRRLWETSADLLAWWPGRAEQLAGFRLAAGRLFCQQGDGRLLALDAESGSVRWRRAAPGAGLGSPYPAGRLSPHYHADQDAVLVQTSAGACWRLDAATGALTRATPTRPWSDAPLPCGGGEFLAAAGSNRVDRFDPASGRQRWSYTARGETTLTGEPPRLAAGGNAVLVLVATNLGHVLRCLDRDTGRPRWEQPLPAPGTAETSPGEATPDPADWALDEDAVYFVRGGRLCAWRLADGKPAWERPLGGPDGPWRVRRAADCVLAYPAAVPGVRFTFRWLAARLQWGVSPSPREGLGPGLPLVCCDSSTGQVVQRLNFADPPAPRPGAEPPGRAAVLPEVRWGRGAPDGGAPWVRLTGRGAAVAAGSRLWALAAPDAP
jgi:outer membrane protein assembly factor BamB